MMRSRGFSLIEMLVTLGILAVLAAMAVPLMQASNQRDKELELRTALRDIRGAIDAYKQATLDGRVQIAANDSGYPKSLETLSEGIKDATDPGGKKRLYFLRRIPRDPFADTRLAPADTWGLRSYASSAEAPIPGADVFDVYSRSTRIGFNGIAYKDW